jgi:hypothetical protein
VLCLWRQGEPKVLGHAVQASEKPTLISYAEWREIQLAQKGARRSDDACAPGTAHAGAPNGNARVSVLNGSQDRGVHEVGIILVDA